MREKYIFFIGLGVGIVITSIISLFSYNILVRDNIKSEKEIFDTKAQATLETTLETLSSNISETSIDTSLKNMEITTKKPFEITTTKPFEITTN